MELDRRPIVLSSDGDDDDDEEIQTVRVRRFRTNSTDRRRRRRRLIINENASSTYQDEPIEIDDNDSNDDIEITSIVTVPDRGIEYDRMQRQRLEMIQSENRLRQQELERRQRLEALRNNRVRRSDIFSTPVNNNINNDDHTNNRNNTRNNNSNSNENRNRNNNINRGSWWSFPGFNLVLPLFGEEEEIEDSTRDADDLIMFLERQSRAAQATAFAGNGYGEDDTPMMNRENDLLREALFRSLQDTGVERPTISQNDIKGTPIPENTLPGFTRSLDPNQKSVCARCDCELGVGLQEGEDKWATEGDKLLSKRVFFAKCGHVYCGRCVNAIVNRKPGQRGDPLRVCAAKSCKQSFAKTKKPFNEIFY